MATPYYAAGCVAGEAPISRAQHHISASRGWHVNVANHSRHSRGTNGVLPPVAEGSFSPARVLFACLERVRYACREEPATPIMRSLQGIVRVLHAGTVMRAVNLFVALCLFTSVFIGIALISAVATSVVHAQFSSRSVPMSVVQD